MSAGAAAPLRLAPAQILIGPIDTLGAALSGLAPGATSVILVDPRTPPATGAQLIDLAARKGDDAGRFARAALRVIRQALRHCGRHLTRTRFLSGVDAVKLDDSEWPTLDYSADRLAGARGVAFVKAK